LSASAISRTIPLRSWRLIFASRRSLRFSACGVPGRCCFGRSAGFYRWPNLWWLRQPLPRIEPFIVLAMVIRDVPGSRTRLSHSLAGIARQRLGLEICASGDAPGILGSFAALIQPGGSGPSSDSTHLSLAHRRCLQVVFTRMIGRVFFRGVRPIVSAFGPTPGFSRRPAGAADASASDRCCLGLLFLYQVFGRCRGAGLRVQINAPVRPKMSDRPPVPDRPRSHATRPGDAIRS